MVLLRSESPNAERNGQPDHDHVHGEAENQIMQRVRASGMKSGERQDDQIHHFLYGSAKE